VRSPFCVFLLFCCMCDAFSADTSARRCPLNEGPAHFTGTAPQVDGTMFRGQDARPADRVGYELWSMTTCSTARPAPPTCCVTHPKRTSNVAGATLSFFRATRCYCVLFACTQFCMQRHNTVCCGSGGSPTCRCGCSPAPRWTRARSTCGRHRLAHGVSGLATRQAARQERSGGATACTLHVGRQPVTESPGTRGRRSKMRTQHPLR